MSVVEQSAPGPTWRQAWALIWALVAALVVWMFVAVWPEWLDAVLISKKAFINSIFNGVTLAGLYFLVASGFTLVFGLMRNVNLAHGSLYLLGAYIGYEVVQRTGIWLLGVGAGFMALSLIGILMQVFVFRRLEGDELRQTLVTLGISIVAADLMLAIWTGITYQIGVPAWLDGAIKLPIVTTVRANGTAVMMTYPFYRLIVLGTAIVVGVGLWLMISRTRIGMMIRAGVDDRSMLSASGINVHMVFAVVFAVGAGLAGFAGVVGGSALSLAPGEDVRYLIASLVVVIVGGMGSIPGAAIGALLVGSAEQIGLVYLPTYGIVLTFVIMVVALALRPQGIMGTTRTSATPVLALDQPSRAAVVPARFGPAQIALAVALLLYPAVASEFFVAQIGAYSLIWGLLALSMMLLAGYGGMVSLAQITTAGVAAYTVAIFGTNNMNIHGFGWPWWVLVPFAVLVAATVSALIGAISVRTEGIYTIMITLAIAASFFYFAQQNYALFNGHSGYAGIPTPRVFGIDWRDPVPFYYLCLLVAAACYAAVLYCSRSTFGLALQAIRDNGRRMRAVGFNVTAHKVVAYFYSGVIAGLAGVLLVWFNGRVSPGTVDVGQAVEVLVIAVIGGLRHPIGPFVGAAFVILIQTFAIDIVGAERYNTLIGLVFLAIVFASPDGLLGLWGRLKPLLAAESLRSRVSGEASLRAQTESNPGRIG
jgi:branched-chain amino acid transport system permease protein